MAVNCCSTLIQKECQQILWGVNKICLRFATDKRCLGTLSCWTFLSIFLSDWNQLQYLRLVFISVMVYLSNTVLPALAKLQYHTPVKLSLKCDRVQTMYVDLLSSVSIYCLNFLSKLFNKNWCLVPCMNHQRQRKLSSPTHQIKKEH